MLPSLPVDGNCRSRASAILYRLRRRVAKANDLVGNEVKDNKVITSKYTIHISQVNGWKKQFKRGIAEIFRDKRRKDETERETLIDELYKQIGQQKVEIDFLKKKSKLFS